MVGVGSNRIGTPDALQVCYLLPTTSLCFTA